MPILLRLRRALFCVLSVNCALGLLASYDAAAMPNVIVIFADDIGWQDLACYGAKDLLTPNIDALATNGIRFTRAYASAPICGPSRAGMLTGRYQQRFGYETNPGTSLEDNPAFGLPLTESTIGDRFKGLGYTTGWIGKSHLGWNVVYRPDKRGFDYFYGFLQSHHDYLNASNPVKYAIDPIRRIDGTGDNPVTLSPSTYLTYAFAGEAVQFIETHQAEPFFLFLPFNALHFPLQSTQDLKDRAAGLPIDDGAYPNRRALAEVLLGLDDAVGAVVDKLVETDLYDDTLIIFTSDNGGDTSFLNGAINLPLRGGKTEVYEGGIRVPFIVQWPNQLPVGVVNDAMVSTLDILPTAIAATGASVPAAWQLDGVDLLPCILGQNTTAPHEALFWRVETDGLPQGLNPAVPDVPDGVRAMRWDQWKLVKPAIDAAWELYDFSTMAGERELPQANVADENPEILRAMIETYEDWSARMVRPRWAVNDLDYSDPENLIDDIRIGSATTSYDDPDFLRSEVAFQNGGTLWRGQMDPATGHFVSLDGRDQQVDTGLAIGLGGPKWALSSSGPSLFYTKPGAFSHQQIWRARFTPAVSVDQRTASQSNSSHHVRVSQEADDTSAHLAFQVGAATWWEDEAAPLAAQPIPDHAGGVTNGQWIPRSDDLAFIATPDAQVTRFLTQTGSSELISDDAGVKAEPWGFLAPEFGDELCFAAIVNRRVVAIYRDPDPSAAGPWTRWATLHLPASVPQRFLYSLRPLDGLRGFNGTSWFTCSAFEHDNPQKPGATEIWLLGLGSDPKYRVARRIDEAAGVDHFKPKTLAGTTEVFCYYTRTNGVDPAQLRRARTGLDRPDFRGQPSGFAALSHSWSFHAGAEDKHGTETTHFAAHDGMLFAAQGSRGNIGAIGTGTWSGAQILVKKSPTDPWQIETTLIAHLAVGVMEEILVVKEGNSPIAPARVLLAGFSDIGGPGGNLVGTRARIGPGNWQHSTIAAASGPAHPISFGTHLDGGPSGTQYVFAGLSNGEIHRGVYDSGHPGYIDWSSSPGQTPNPELSGVGPVTSFVNAGGAIHAACGMAASGRGGLYRRDDASGTWTLVYQWPTPLPLAASSVGSRLMTGLTRVPDPLGTENDVIIGARSWPGVIERIDPANDYSVTIELDVRDFFARLWGDDSVRDAGVRIGYNKFTHVTDPLSGERIQLIGVWIERPGETSPRGSHFLIRHEDGTYEAAEIDPLASPTPIGADLRGTRCIAVSPFEQDAGLVFYFGGYDVNGVAAQDTAWIVTAGWSKWPELTGSPLNPPFFEFSWPTLSNDWTLESSESMHSASWQPILGLPTRSYDITTLSISIPSDVDRAFFRLNKP